MDRRLRIEYGAILLAIALVVAAAQAAGAASPKPPNLVSNPGFESAVNAPLTSCGSLPVSKGNWTGYTEAPGQGPAIVTSPVHGGMFSAEWKGTQTGSCVGGGWYQDVGFTSGNSYTLVAYVHPELGTENVSLIEGWNRGCCTTTVSEDDAIISPTATTFKMWNKAVTAPPLAYNVWHKVQLVADRVKLSGALSSTARSSPPSHTAAGTQAARRATRSSTSDTLQERTRRRAISSSTMQSSQAGHS
jgi:hypothetical protein